MEYNNPSDIVKTLTFGAQAKQEIMSGVEILENAVKSTLGASGKCVIYEDAGGRPVITKDGVTVAESVVLLHPVENIGATLIKEAASNTVKEAGEGTTTATGRAACRGCGKKIAKDELRFGEQLENPYGEGVRTLWYHPRCVSAVTTSSA